MPAKSAQQAPWGARVLRRLAAEGTVAWMLSLLMHVGVILIMAFFWIVIVPPDRKQQIGSIRLQALDADDYPPGTVRFGDSETLKMSGRLPTPGTTAWAKRTPETITWRGAEPLTGTTSTIVALIGGKDPHDVNLIPRGPDDPTSLVPRKIRRSENIGANSKIIYLLDGSGSMLSRLDAIKSRLCADLSFLTFDRATGRGNYFNIIFFRTKAAAFWSALLPATNGNKIAAVRWLKEIRAEGGTNPIPALELAFGHNPDYVVILSDGEFDRKVLKRVEQLQRRRKNRVRIITIGYGEDFSGKNLEELAAGNGGRFIRLIEE